MSDVIAPPYDIIGPELQDQLYKKHPANAIRLILNREEPGDDAANVFGEPLIHVEKGVGVTAPKPLNQFGRQLAFSFGAHPSCHSYAGIGVIEQKSPPPLRGRVRERGILSRKIAPAYMAA